jgi:7-cyano-7-deazaguanine reductase
MTGIKDLYKIKIKYVPDKIIPELKSLKLYFWGYENLPISHEHIIAKIFKDFEIIIKPKKLAILLYVAERGEMITTIAIGDEKLLNFTRFFQDENFGR